MKLLLCCVLATLACAQDQHPITKRQIAPVMGEGGADWLTRPEREAEEHPEAALDEIGIPKGVTVADIGAGVGFYTLRLARRVGPTGTVYANDIQPGMLDRLKERVEAAGVKNVIPVLGTVSDPKLPANAIDLELLVDVYHEFSEPEKMVRKLREALKPEGRMVLLEFRGEDKDLPIQPLHKMTVAQVRAEIEPEGFRLAKRSEILPRQHILIFTKKERP
jgi:ubiquinone/menaquinone biosynthesis C-methylase UbiE